MLLNIFCSSRIKAVCVISIYNTDNGQIGLYCGSSLPPAYIPTLSHMVSAGSRVDKSRPMSCKPIVVRVLVKSAVWDGQQQALVNTCPFIEFELEGCLELVYKTGDNALNCSNGWTVAYYSDSAMKYNGEQFSARPYVWYKWTVKVLIAVKGISPNFGHRCIWVYRCAVYILGSKGQRTRSQQVLF